MYYNCHVVCGVYCYGRGYQVLTSFWAAFMYRAQAACVLTQLYSIIEDSRADGRLQTIQQGTDACWELKEQILGTTHQSGTPTVTVVVNKSSS